jgi:hypothetical protein
MFRRVSIRRAISCLRRESIFLIIFLLLDICDSLELAALVMPWRQLAGLVRQRHKTDKVLPQEHTGR